MHIIMGTKNAMAFKDKYTVLELDTFKIMPDGHLISAYCIIENIPITDMARVDSMRDLHCNLIKNYRKKDWNFCKQALEHLTNFWGGELQTFYHDLQQRITQYEQEDPGSNWDGFIEKSPQE